MSAPNPQVDNLNIALSVAIEQRNAAQNAVIDATVRAVAAERRAQEGESRLSQLTLLEAMAALPPAPPGPGVAPAATDP